MMTSEVCYIRIASHIRGKFGGSLLSTNPEFSTSPYEMIPHLEANIPLRNLNLAMFPGIPEPNTDRESSDEEGLI
jgi:hypothetical protein